MTPSIRPGRPGRPGILSGAVIGVMLMASLIAVFYLAWRLAGLPFVAFDAFDWLARTLPGSVVTYGIDAMVSVIWGTTLGWSYRRLSAAGTAKAARIDRRRFLIRLGGATAVITVVGAEVEHRADHLVADGMNVVRNIHTNEMIITLALI